MAHFLWLSPTTGLNLDTVVAWSEDTMSVPETLMTATGPRQTYRQDVPCVRVECLNGIVHAYVDTERETLLAHLQTAGLRLLQEEPPTLYGAKKGYGDHFSAPADWKIVTAVHQEEPT